jgi:hypothetical protein
MNTSQPQKNPSKKNNNNKVCPYLGLPIDPQTSMEYPSSQNYCHHVTPPSAPGANHQRQYCLEPFHTRCKLYDAKYDKPMPEAFLKEAFTPAKRKPIFHWWLFGLSLLVLIGIASWLALTWVLPYTFISPSGLSQADSDATIIMEAIQTRAARTLEPQHTPIVIIIPTLEPSPTTIPTPLPTHQLEMPIGDQQQFILHRVLDGESLLLFADTYKTSVEAIRAANYNLSSTLWSNTILVVPLNQTNPAGILPMTASSIDEDEISMDAFAHEQSVSVDSLASLNNLPSDYIFHSGEWVIVPHTSPTP